MEKSAEFMFVLDTVFLKDEETGTYTAFFAQWPNASAEGRTKEEAKMLLHEIFPVRLEDEAEQLINAFHNEHKKSATFERQIIHA